MMNSGISVICVGIIMDIRYIRKNTPAPLKRILAIANAAIEEDNTVITVKVMLTNRLFRIAFPKGKSEKTFL